MFAGAFDRFVVQTLASNCCSGGTDASLSSASDAQCECLGSSYPFSSSVCSDSHASCSTINTCHSESPDYTNCVAHCKNADSSRQGVIAYVTEGGSVVSPRPIRRKHK